MPYIIGAFLVALLAVSFWHVSQNNRLQHHWQKQLDANTARFLIQFAWVRTAQVIGAIVAAMLAILVMNNQQLAQQGSGASAAGQATAVKLEELTKAQQQQMQLLQDQQTKIQQLLTQVSAQRIAPAERVPQVTVTAQAVPPTAQQGDTINGNIADRVESQAQPVTLNDVYNPEQASSDKQSNMDGIKKRYEGLLVNYLFLKKCGLVNPQDYHTIISTLAREMASVNAPGRMENDILISAQGSYNEMYSKSACSGPEIKPLYNQYTDYIKTISGNMPPQLVGKTPPQ